MRDHNKMFCQLVAESFECPGPVYEFGSYQVEGQEDYADLRGFFPDKDFVGCDIRLGPGVDRVEDISDLTLPDACAGTVLCIETFEHVFELRRAFDEVYRVLQPGGLCIITSPLNFRIHAYPDDYWRMTPNCLRRLLEPYEARLVGAQGYPKFPHTVMALAAKAPAPADFAIKAEQLGCAYQNWLERVEAEIPAKAKLRRGFAQLYRSKWERYQVAWHFKTQFELDLAPQLRPIPAQAG